MNEHKPNCSINLKCLVYHPDGVCSGFRGCDCKSPSPVEEKCKCGGTLRILNVETRASGSKLVTKGIQYQCENCVTIHFKSAPQESWEKKLEFRYGPDVTVFDAELHFEGLLAFMRHTIQSERRKAVEEVVVKIARREGWEESENFYRREFDLPEVKFKESK